VDGIDDVERETGAPVKNEECCGAGRKEWREKAAASSGVASAFGPGGTTGGSDFLLNFRPNIGGAV
jgi:hypothetical protein